MPARFYIPYDKIKEGESVELEVKFTGEMVAEFSRMIGDADSFHVSDESAAMTVFGKRIVHGLHIAAFLSTLIGKKLPGFGTVYCSQTLDFKKPVYLDETVTITVTVLEKRSRQRLLLSTTVTDSQGADILTGEAVVKTFR
jgi:3-hydroxybutyryl-CoA dehydratase